MTDYNAKLMGDPSSMAVHLGLQGLSVVTCREQLDSLKLCAQRALVANAWARSLNKKAEQNLCEPTSEDMTQS